MPLASFAAPCLSRPSAGVDRYLGIPYAAPPVGQRRFAPPEPAQPWAPKKLDVSEYGPDCWQSTDPVMNPRIGHSMSEDCLYLNVFTPAGHASRTKQGRLFSGRKLLPVMVWFHGGAFQQGGANRAEVRSGGERSDELRRHLYGASSAATTQFECRMNHLRLCESLHSSLHSSCRLQLVAKRRV